MHTIVKTLNRLISEGKSGALQMQLKEFNVIGMQTQGIKKDLIPRKKKS